MTRLNTREFSLMNHPARRWSQRWLELPTFTRLLARTGVELHGARLLDAGCGNGYGLELLERTFAPRRLVGIDLMPEQIERARARGTRAELAVADITAIAEPDGAFDGVFVFGILHHVPAWRCALAELGRVVRPGGVLLVEELHGTFVRLEDLVLRTSHPREAAFDWPAFRRELATSGFAIAAETGVPGIRSFAAIKRSKG